MLFTGSKVIRDDGKLFEVKETPVSHWVTVIAEDDEECRIKSFGPNMYVSDGEIGKGFQEPKYIALQSLKHGSRFYSSFSNRGIHEDVPPEELNDGTVAYEVLGYFVSSKDAEDFLFRRIGRVSP